MATEPSIVFDSTVTALGKSSEPLLTAADLTAVVRVDAVVRAPEAMRTLAGREVTVQLRQAAKAGDSARFSTRGLLYGASLAVEEVAARKAVPSAPARVGERAETALELDRVNRLRAELKSRAAEAASIVVGQVVSVTGPAATGRNAPRSSEHDPHWSTATVTVGSVLKGRASKSVKVVFANSQALVHGG